MDDGSYIQILHADQIPNIKYSIYNSEHNIFRWPVKKKWTLSERFLTNHKTVTSQTEEEDNLHFYEHNWWNRI